jgi:hypothetical protein
MLVLRNSPTIPAHGELPHELPWIDKVKLFRRRDFEQHGGKISLPHPDLSPDSVDWESFNKAQSIQGCSHDGSLSSYNFSLLNESDPANLWAGTNANASCAVELACQNAAIGIPACLINPLQVRQKPVGRGQPRPEDRNALRGGWERPRLGYSVCRLHLVTFPGAV